MKVIEKIGNVIISDIIVIPVVVYWYAVWNIQDLYLFPENLALSNGLSLSFGIIGLTFLGIVQYTLTRNLENKQRVLFFFISRFILFLWGTAGVCHWRGLWNFLDNYTSNSTSEILLAASLVVLCLFRSVRNILAPPFVTGFDGKRSQLFLQPMIFSRTINQTLPHGLDTLLSVVFLGSLVVVFWRNAWKILDDYLFPNNHIKTIIFSVIIFITIQFTAGLIQIVFHKTHKYVENRKYLVRLIIQDLYFIILGFGSVACWRSIWKAADLIIAIAGPSIGLGSMCASSFILLVSVCSSTSIVLKGYIMDGAVDKWYQPPIDYIGNFKACFCTNKTEINSSKDIPVEFIIHL